MAEYHLRCMYRHSSKCKANTKSLIRLLVLLGRRILMWVSEVWCFPNSLIRLCRLDHYHFHRLWVLAARSLSLDWPREQDVLMIRVSALYNNGQLRSIPCGCFLRSFVEKKLAIILATLLVLEAIAKVILTANFLLTAKGSLVYHPPTSTQVYWLLFCSGCFAFGWKLYTMRDRQYPASISFHH